MFHWESKNMNHQQTLDNYLFDEENQHTQAADLWDDFFAESADEIDERPWVQADSLAHRNDLSLQVCTMLKRVLTEEEEEIIRLYFGIQRRRHSLEELAALFQDESHATTLLHTAINKLRYSDEILFIYKYLNT